MNFKLDQRGALIDPDFHDGAIDALDVSDDRCARIILTTGAGARYQVEFPELERLRCDDFRQGNIILDVSIFTSARPPEDYLRLILDLDKKESSEYLIKVINLIETGELLLFSVMPSYGCELHVLSKSVAFHELSQTTS